VRKGAEEKQAFVEADELVRIVELQRGELGEEFVTSDGVGGVDAILSGFELGEELVGIVRGGRHGAAKQR